MLEKEKAARARRVERRARRRALVQRLAPQRRSSGTLHRRSRGERLGIVLLPLAAIAAIWLWVPETSLRIVLTLLIVLAAPALVVVVLGRKAG
ncbi:hypothetical protein AB0J83_31145 [Actinoplanes sp. NPDC049596]|uniref:hypothetical protein n=1 Tax=unclassified Actinoplanes TaxID=2626549 RepID=UPI003419EA75